MPRPRKAPTGPNAIIASAARIQGRRARGNVTTAGASGEWQNEAIFMVTAVGELGFYRDWKANAFSRVTVDLEYITVEDGEEKTTKVTTANAVALGPLAEQALAAREALFDGDDGESELMRAFGQQLSVPGEAWLFGIAEPNLEDPDAPDRWRVLARTELKQSGSTWEVNRGDGNEERYSMGDPTTGEGAEAIAIRIWNPNPDMWAQADSSVRNALPILRQIKGLHELDGASIDSRLKGAGVVFVPSEMTFSAPLDPNGDPGDVRQDEFMADLTEVMMLARTDRSSAAAHVPIVVKVPGALIEKIKHITFDTPFDERSDAKLDRAITRLATTLDCPAQVLLGLADVNHWTGWLLDEQALKYHVQSPAGLVMDGLTKRYLWATLAGPSGVLPPEVRAFRFKANVSKLQQKPDRAVNAPAAHAELLITDKAYAATIGFDPVDLLDPTSDEFQRRILMAAAMRPGGPDAVTQAMTALGVKGISPPAAMVAPGQAPPPAITGPDQGAAPDGGDGPPVQPTAPPAAPVAAAGEVPDLRAAALILGCEARVERAIEKARNRVHQRSKAGRPIPADRMDWALEGAWEQVPRIAAALDVDETALLDALNRYTRGVLSTGTDHSPDVFTRVIKERVLRA